jgi:protein-S-isoprenylcysteine O-methyltransferase Ste14
MNERKPHIPKGKLLIYLSIFVVVPILTYFMGKRLDQILFLPTFPIYPINLLIGLPIFYFGLSIGITSTKILYREGFGLPWGEVDKQAQSSKHVNTGPYAYTRNPMILGYSLLPCGMGFMFRSPSMFILVPLIVVIINIFIVKKWEEPKLESRFGQEYLVYKKTTPFLVPKIENFVKLIKESYLGKPNNDE